MANTERRLFDRQGKMFIPMNVEGNTYNYRFITSFKLGCIVTIVASAIIIGLYLSAGNNNARTYIVWYAIWFAISFYVTRYIVFEEKFYYRVYKELQENEITTPSLFWDIASIKDTDDGAVFIYSDTKVGIIVKLERDTITGKHSDFKEEHYDAISEFYKELHKNRLSFVQMNIVETAGKDERLKELDKLITNYTNENSMKLMKIQVGHLKTISQKILYENDYILIYTNDINRVDTLISDATECIYRILDGAYSSYSILDSTEIGELNRDMFSVGYFNPAEASLHVYNRGANSAEKPFYIRGIVWDTGEEQLLDNSEVNRLNKIADQILFGGNKNRDMRLKEGFYDQRQSNIGVEFERLADSFLDGSNGEKIEPMKEENQQYSKNKRRVGRKSVYRGSKEMPNKETKNTEEIYIDF